MMMRSVLIFLATFYLSSGCAEREFAPLDDLVLTCASDDDCPDNFFCETRLDPPECLELANRDVEAPSLEERSVLPTIAKERTILHAYFTVSEPLSGRWPPGFFG